jgi:glycosyltransferase involved in cell wall biosynthesis
MAGRILFISKGEDSASTRYRALQYFPLLQQAGFNVSHATAAGNPMNYLNALRQAALADIVVVLRKTFPPPFLWSLRSLSRRLVFDFDDAIFCNTDGSSSATRMRRFSAMAKVCDHIFAGNSFLAECAARFNPEVSVVPTSVDVSRYGGKCDKPVNTVDLVWIGSRSTRKYLCEALPALRLAAAKVSGLRLKIIADFDLPDAGLPTLAVPWSAEIEANALASSHIGIAPMRDDDWSRGKCALKVLQYMASGLPVVSSDVGANAEVLGMMKNACLAGSDAAWAEDIARLANDAELRARLAIEGRQRVSCDYSIESVFLRMRSVFAALS